MQLPILLQDKHIVVINKPAGLLVHKSALDKHEQVFVLQTLRDQLGKFVYPVHRLDKPTSGILIFAFSSDIAARMQEQFIQQKVLKHYIAIVRGYTPGDLGIHHPVKAQKDKYLKSSTSEAVTTHLTTLDHAEIDVANSRYPSSRYSLVSLNPLSGKRHQLRYHMKHIRHPIIGDAKYGKSEHNRIFEQRFGACRLFLHACKISFIHPFDQRPVTIECSPDGLFKRVIQELGWQTDLT